MQRIIFILSLFFWSVMASAQSKDLPVEKIQRTKGNYKSFVLSGNRAFVLTESGQLVIWDLDKMDIIHLADDNSSGKYTAIAKDKQGQVFMGTNRGAVYQIDPENLSCSLFLQDKYYVQAICFNSVNKIYLIVPKGVYEPQSKKLWADFAHSSNSLSVKGEKKVVDKYFRQPQITYIDQQDKIWMTSSFGEFGGSLQLFDAKKEQILSSDFDSLEMGLFFPKSIFEDEKGNVYISSGLQHFSNTGEIYQFAANRKVNKIYNSEDYRDTSRRNDLGIFVGPGTYNKTDHSIYFASTKGFFKAVLPDSGKLPKPELLFNPSLHWQSEAMAIGVSMSIKQMDWTTDNKLVFLTSGDGLGVYTGAKLYLLQ